jgi:hypothetical protein
MVSTRVGRLKKSTRLAPLEISRFDGKGEEHAHQDIKAFALGVVVCAFRLGKAASRGLPPGQLALLPALETPPPFSLFANAYHTCSKVKACEAVANAVFDLIPSARRPRCGPPNGSPALHCHLLVHFAVRRRRMLK